MPKHFDYKLYNLEKLFEIKIDKSLFNLNEYQKPIQYEQRKFKFEQEPQIE